MENNLETYSQWVKITIISDSVLNIMEATVSAGKFHKEHEQDANLTPEDINKIQISAGQNGIICASGASRAMKGTEGSFKIHQGENVVGKYSWDCPYWSSDNKSIWTDMQDPKNPLFYVHFSPGKGATTGECIGDVQIELYPN